MRGVPKPGFSLRRGVRGPRVRNNSGKHVWGPRPRTILTFVLRNLGPQTLSEQNLCAILVYLLKTHLLAYLGELAALTLGGLRKR